MASLRLLDLLDSSLPLEEVMEFVEAHPESVRRERDEDGRTPLMVALTPMQAPADVALYLLEQWPEAAKVQNFCGDLPLHIAVYYEAPLDLVKFLLESYPQAISCPNPAGLLPLHMAGQSDDYLEVICFLFDQFPPALKSLDSAGNNPLHLACLRVSTSPNVIQFLVEQWPDNVKGINAVGRLPLHCACLSAGISLQVVQVLVRAYPDSVEVMDRRRRLPLTDVLCLPREREVIRYLLETQVELDKGFALKRNLALLLQTPERVAIARELLVERRDMIQVLDLDNMFMREDDWNTFVSALVNLTKVETLRLVEVRVRRIHREDLSNFLLRGGVLDGLLERNPYLSSLELREVGSGLSIKGATSLVEHLCRGRLKTIKLDLTLTYEMLRGRPDLWFEE